MTTLTAKRVTGEVARLIAEKGYGFIRMPDGREYFFHAENMSEGPEAFKHLAEGTIVSFLPGKTSKGPRALDVEIS
jgi:cold shock CspA family protein